MKHTHQRTRRGWTILEVLIVVVVLAVLAGFGLPLIDAGSCDAMRQRSTTNLRNLGVAHATYAAEWNQRQFTLVDDALSTRTGACAGDGGRSFCHPPAIIGRRCDQSEFGYFFACEVAGNCPQFDPIRPLNFNGASAGLGAFRIPNAAAFNAYVNGRFFDSTFYAPKDVHVLSRVAEFIDGPCDFPVEANDLVHSSSYVLSAAAMFNPAVFSADGWQDPLLMPDGFQSPPVTLARYPAQKSHMLEHSWLQSTQDDTCNPSFASSVFDCEPYYFNHGSRSNPMTLFYDGHVRGLSANEASQSDARTQHQSHTSLWSRDTPFGNDGYFQDLSFDFTQPAATSYHVLTTDGIMGRDTLK